MTDLIERLRAGPVWGDNSPIGSAVGEVNGATMNEAATLLERQAAEIEALKERGAQAIIAYHVAICSPKGVVPMDEFYDAAIAAKIHADMDRARSVLKSLEAEATSPTPP